MVIPCFNEPDLPATLQSLIQCTATVHAVEVIIVINAADHAPPEIHLQNQKTCADTKAWIARHPTPKITFYPVMIQFPSRHAGVGMARKTGMDESVRRFESIGNRNGVIVCLDADCTVAPNYLAELEAHFLQHPHSNGCVVYFEHPLDGRGFGREVYDAITDYELYLRYYHLRLAYSLYPYPFHTLGSCMAVRSRTYQQQGGMNRRKAGEDFYFLHKIFPLGNFHSLHTTCVFPSPRPSLRVPFGTGSTVDKMLNRQYTITAFNHRSFEDFKFMNERIADLYASTDFSRWMNTLPAPVSSYLLMNNGMTKLKEIRKNSASAESFVKRFYTWFDGLMALQFFHYCRKNGYPDEPLREAAWTLIKEKRPDTDVLHDSKTMLEILRKLDQRR